MSLSIVPAEQLLAQAFAGQIIRSKAGGDNAKGIIAANTAIQFGQGLEQLAAGDPSAALTALTNQLQSSNLDPATLDALQKLQGFALSQVAVAEQFAVFVPAFGATAQAVLTNLGTGIANAGQIDLKNYQAAQAKASAKSAEAPAADSALTRT